MESEYFCTFAEILDDYEEGQGIIRIPGNHSILT
jgi:hypothetical protein